MYYSPFQFSYRLMGEEDSSICSPTEGNWTNILMDNNETSYQLTNQVYQPEKWEEESDPWNNLTSIPNHVSLLASNLNSTTTDTSNTVHTSSMPAAVMIPTGIMLYVLSLLTFVGNAMVLHAIRTDKRLQTVSIHL